MSSETASFYFGSFTVVAYLQFFIYYFFVQFFRVLFSEKFGALQPLNLEGLTSFPSRKKNDIT